MNTKKIKINEIFYSLQGEGSDAGLPTIFIRLTGCNLRCNYCDTRYAFYEGKYMAIDEIMEIIKKWNCRRVCITGGEPLLQKNVYVLIEKLLEEGYETSVETNGSISIMRLSKMGVKIKMDVKLPSSGMQDKILFGNISLLHGDDELKFIIWDRDDYEYAKDIVARYKPRCQIIMQPVWGSKIKLAEWILKDELNVRYSIQLHKILWSNKRGK